MSLDDQATSAVRRLRAQIAPDPPDLGVAVERRRRSRRRSRVAACVLAGMVLVGGAVGFDLRFGSDSTRVTVGTTPSVSRLTSGPIDACELVNRQEVATVTKWKMSPARANRSDSGPPGVTGCIFRAQTGFGFVNVWSLKPGSAFYAEQHASPVDGSRRPIARVGCTGFADISPASESAWILKDDRYVNVVIGTQKQPIAHGAATDLACDAAAKIG